MPKYIPPATFEEAIRVYHEGATLVEAASAVGISRSTLRAYMARNGVPIDGARRKRLLNDNQRAELVRLYSEGVPNREIAKKLGILNTASEGRNLIYSTLRSLGVSRRAPQTSLVGKKAAVGTVTKTTEGYLNEKVAPDWPYLGIMSGYGDGSWIPQHRKVMAERLGRALLKSEQVHHKDGDRANNDPSNLQLRVGGHGSGVSYRCACCGSEDLMPIAVGAAV